MGAVVGILVEDGIQSSMPNISYVPPVRYYKWILERNFNDLNKGVRVNQVTNLCQLYVPQKT